MEPLVGARQCARDQATATDMIEKNTHLGRDYIGGTGEGKDNKEGK